MRTRELCVTVGRQQVLTPTTLHFLRANAQMYNLDLAKADE